MRSTGDTLRDRGYVLFCEVELWKKGKRSVLVALFVYWIRVCDRQETCIDVERNVFLD